MNYNYRNAKIKINYIVKGCNYALIIHSTNNNYKGKKLEHLIVYITKLISSVRDTIRKLIFVFWQITKLDRHKTFNALCRIVVMGYSVLISTIVDYPKSEGNYFFNGSGIFLSLP